VKPACLWKGRYVYLVDGTTVTTPDTLQNLQADPQPVRNHDAGLARLDFACFGYKEPFARHFA
jgi:hypothetical protein